MKGKKAESAIGMGRHLSMLAARTNFILLALALALVFCLYRTQQWREKAMAIAKARADESNRAKTSFLSNMSHDIRTPMNAIIGYTELSKRSGVTEQTLREYMTKIEASSHPLLALVNDALEMARIESGKMSLEPAPIDLLPSLEEMHAEIVKLAQRGGPG